MNSVSLVREIMLTVRILLVCVAIVFGAYFIFSHKSPAQVQTQTASVTKAQEIAREVQAVIEASRLAASMQGGTPLASAPAVTVVRQLLPGFSGAQISAMLSALRQPTREVISAKSHLTSTAKENLPTSVSGWTDAQIQALYIADKAAVANVLANPKTQIATTVTVTREAVQPTRVGSFVMPSGSGLAYAFVRKGHFESDIGAVLHGNHLSPAIGVGYLIPGTSLEIGPGLVIDHQVNPSIQAVIHF